MSLYGSVIEFWTAFDSIISGERQGREFARPETFLQDWRSHLAARAQDAATRLSQINGVTGLILGGGIGKGEMWPLSDVDFIPVYRSEQLESTRQEVADVRVDVERRWLEDGFPAYLDIGGIWFTEDEVQAALSESPNEIHSRLHERRWYHGIDKASSGRILYDANHATEDFHSWISQARCLPETISTRMAGSKSPSEQDHRQTRKAVGGASNLEANLSVRNLLQAYIVHLCKGVWDDSGKLGRNCTRFEALADQHGQAETGRELMRLLEPLPVDKRRWEAAPSYVRARHWISILSRQATQESVSEEQDQRDVIDFFTNIELSHSEPPYPEWTGTGTGRKALHCQLRALELLVNRSSYLSGAP